MAENTETAVRPQKPIASETSVPVFPSVRAPFRSVEKWDYRKTSGLSEATIGTMTSFHRPFIRGLARSLSIYLSAHVEVEAPGGRETSYEEFEGSLTPGSLLAALRLESQPSPVLLILDAAIASPCLELLLGGSGEKPLERSELTDIDVQILAELSRVVAGELQVAWHDLALRFRPEVSVGKGARRQIPFASKLLALDFKMKLGERAGALSLLLPAPVVESILRAVDAAPKSENAGSGQMIGIESTILPNISVAAELLLPPLKIAVRDLVGLTVNSVLPLPLRAGSAARLVVAGTEFFSALPVRSGELRAAMIENPILQPGSYPKET